MFMIVSRDDFPLFEYRIDNLVKSQVVRKKADLYEFIINAALDSSKFGLFPDSFITNC